MTEGQLKRKFRISDAACAIKTYKKYGLYDIHHMAWVYSYEPYFVKQIYLDASYQLEGLVDHN